MNNDHDQEWEDFMVLHRQLSALLNIGLYSRAWTPEELAKMDNLTARMDAITETWEADWEASDSQA
jgi:hypothetical protein